jgi:hypothetical protein
VREKIVEPRIIHAIVVQTKMKIRARIWRSKMFLLCFETAVGGGFAGMVPDTGD